MTTSKVEIVNQALVLLGEAAIATFDDTSEAARLARVTYDSIRDALMQEFTWNFLVTRDSASLSAVTPTWGPTYAYPLDPDDLRVLKVQGDENNDWAVELHNGAPHVVTDLESPIYYLALRRSEDVSRYPALFVQALASRLALEWAEALGRSESLMQRLASIYNGKLKLARQVDSQERTPAIIDADLWADSRRFGGMVPLAKLSGPPDPLGY